MLDLQYIIEFDNVTLSAALRQLNRQTQINFSYNPVIIPKMDKFSVSYDTVTLRFVLEDILSKANLYFKEVNGTVVVLKQPITNRVLKGQVLDAETQTPLPYANVFIDNSTFGVASDREGYFDIKNIPEMAFNLVVSYVGYEPKTMVFNYKQPLDNSRYIVEMEVAELDLEPVEVLANKTRKQRKSDRRLLKRFEEDFLGRDSNAKECRILNPEVLDFFLLDSLGNYEVTASDKLLIENYALGYEVGYMLDEFTFINGTKTYIGNAQFRELEPKSRKQNSKWEEARAKAYYGSVNHFLNSLIQGKVAEEGFSVNIVQFDSVTSEYSTPLNPAKISEIIRLTPADKELEYKLVASSDIEVTYTKGFEDDDYKKLFRSKSKSGNYKYTDQKSRSTISLSNDQSLTSYQVVGMDISDVPLYQKSVILFQEDDPMVSYPGYFSSMRSALYLGWWTWGGFSVKLPLNYRPKEQDQ
ncbi:carboxypeptidase-like regulatory domain-containing protein [Roseivirga echinicomitans]